MGGLVYPLNEKFGAVTGTYELVDAQAAHPVRHFKGQVVQFDCAQGSFTGAVFTEEYFGAQFRRAIDHSRHRNGLASLVGFQYLATVGQIVLRLPQRLEEEIHGAATDQAVAGGYIFIQQIIAELRSAMMAKDFLGGEPDIAFHTPASQCAHTASVLADQQFGSRLLGRGTLGAHHRGEDALLPLVQLLDRFLNHFSHAVRLYCEVCSRIAVLLLSFKRSRPRLSLI